MSDGEPERSRRARAAAELALTSVAYHYGAKPGFVLLGGLMPELLCSDSTWLHAGTTDVDVQVNLEIAAGAANASRLEQALRDAHFQPSNDKVWRWIQVDAGGRKTIVKFELLADLDTERAETVINFAGAENLGAVNLRGTGYATKGAVEREFRAEVDGALRVVRLDVASLPGYLIAKAAAAHGRNKDKDWYDIAFVLLHNDAGGHDEAARQVVATFGKSPGTHMHTWLVNLRANFDDPGAPGPNAYVTQLRIDHPDADLEEAAADAVLAVTGFCDIVDGRTR
ncbi:nucleotidyl transferase AbiEii/AbiGii toxin family protein [Phytoactinopolyspora limicola]|uniref:nucleotidyl transferase AbiEii/AbiGii toxin family protein n=1 Tax=Phytoactinopolyspora limicola TaxID=2715536 RepID=UPI00140D5CC6|nr:nucleotidyl transferase AbiEii/AbiGii toxin family protein [Phytoactinopolyspora limicola]